MAIKHYIIEVDKEDHYCKFKITFKAGQFSRMEKLSGNLTTLEWKGLGYIITRTEEDLLLTPDQYQSITVKEFIKGEKSLYTRCMDEYHHFYIQLNEMSPRINAIEGKALKMIIAFLSKNCADDEEIFTTWKVILDNWKKLDKFYQKQQDLRNINSNINTILRQIKHGNSTTKSQASSFSKSTRESL